MSGSSTELVAGQARWALVLALAVGCSPPAASSLEAVPALEEVKFDGPFAVAPPAPPAAARPPQLTPCPPGWRADGQSPALCEPWPDAGIAGCGLDSAHFPGEPGCARVGTACPAGGWADPFPAGQAVRYVLASAGDGGVGSQTAPYGTFLEAAAAAQPGEIIALGRGTYFTNGAVRPGVTIWGACVAETTLSAAMPATATEVVLATGPGVAVRNLRIVGPPVGATAFGSTAQLDLTDVIIDGAQTIGWSVEGRARSTGKSLVIRATAPYPDGTDGNGIQVAEGCSLEGTRVVIDRARDHGVIADGPGTTVTLTELAVLGTLPRDSDRTSGIGVVSQRGAVVTLTRATVERSNDVGLLALDAALRLFDVVVRDTLARQSDQTRGYGLSIFNAAVVATRLRAEHNRTQGIFVRGASSQATLTDVVVRNTVATAELASGVGIAAITGSALTIERGLLVGNQSVGLMGGSMGTSLTLTDLIVEDTRADLQGRAGWGLFLTGGAKGTLTRGRLERNRQAGAAISGAFQATDLVIRDTQEANGSGVGLLVQSGILASVARLSVEGNATSGMMVSDPGTQLELSDAVIRDSQPDAREGLDGVGVYVLSGAHLTGTRMLIDGNKTGGLLATGEGSLADLGEVTIANTALPPCIGRPACDGLLSTGVLATADAGVRLSRFLVTRNGGVGVQLAEGGQLDLTDGEVSYQGVGANLVSSSFDVARIDQRVRYRGNDQKLTANVVPLPRVPAPPTGP